MTTHLKSTRTYVWPVTRRGKKISSSVSERSVGSKAPSVADLLPSPLLYTESIAMKALSKHG